MLRSNSAAAYFPQQFGEQTPKTIISTLKSLLYVKKHEVPLAVLGDINSHNSIGNCALCMDDRIIYLYFPHLTYRAVTIHYSEIDHVQLTPEGSCSFIDIIKKSGEPVKLLIIAPPQETYKFFVFLQSLHEPDKKLLGLDVVSLNCPACGAEIKTTKGSTVKCEYCGTAVNV